MASSSRPPCGFYTEVFGLGRLCPQTEAELLGRSLADFRPESCEVMENAVLAAVGLLESVPPHGTQLRGRVLPKFSSSLSVTFLLCIRSRKQLLMISGNRRRESLAWAHSQLSELLSFLPRFVRQNNASLLDAAIYGRYRQQSVLGIVHR